MKTLHVLGLAVVGLPLWLAGLAPSPHNRFRVSRHRWWRRIPRVCGRVQLALRPFRVRRLLHQLHRLRRILHLHPSACLSRSVETQIRHGSAAALVAGRTLCGPFCLPAVPR